MNDRRIGLKLAVIAERQIRLSGVKRVDWSEWGRKPITVHPAI